MHNLLFCVHTLYMSYVTKTFLLVSSSVSSKQLLCFVHGQGQKREQKHRIKNFVEFHNHSPLLTMVCNHTNDNKIGRPRRGSPICLSHKNYNFRGKKKSQVIKGREILH